MCLRDKTHVKKDTVCAECLKTINNEPSKPALSQISPELRALFTQLTDEHKDFDSCWKTDYKYLTIEGKKLNIENIFYGFYKADIGNFCIKRVCGTVTCVNPMHLRSRFEQPDITKRVRAGFNRKNTDIRDLSDSDWLKQP